MAWSEGHCNAKEGDKEATELAMNPEVAIANESGVEPPSGTTITAGGIVTAWAEWRTEWQRERERVLLGCKNLLKSSSCYSHHCNSGHHPHMVTAAPPTRPKQNQSAMSPHGKAACALSF